MLAPGIAVPPQQSVAPGRHLAALELKRVLAVQLLGVDQLADHGQHADALVKSVEPPELRHRAGHHSHLSRKDVA